MRLLHLVDVALQAEGPAPASRTRLEISATTTNSGKSWSTSPLAALSWQFALAEPACLNGRR